MSLTTDDVRRIAKLARIEIDDADALATQSRLNAIFDLIEQMQSVDTTGVEPMAHAGDLRQRLRADVPTETDQRAAFQAVAPAVENGLYLVPRVVE
jgi:aspartyl-tRNA(Asn)/glutamyl-tRNA(Gln) amidotransferase subunit C